MYKVFMFWTGNNKLTKNRLESIEQFKKISECEIEFITLDNLENYILPQYPLHPAFEYLSLVHKCDYLRTYFMHLHGGGYSDIKKTTGSWKNSFNQLEKSDKWIIGYPEVKHGVAYPPNKSKWNELIGNGAYICKPNTPLTQEWFDKMNQLLDSKLELLKKYPASNPRDKAEISKYPIEWNEMLGRIFHNVSYKYKDKIARNLPISIFKNYQ